MKKHFPSPAATRKACAQLILLCLVLVHAAKAQNLHFAKSFPNTVPQGGALEGRGIALDGAGNMYVVGSFQNAADFDPGVGTQNLIAAGNYDIFLAKYDASGNYVWAKSIGNTSNDQAYALAVDASGNSYITGYFTGTVDFDPGAGTQNLSSTSTTNDIFLAKYDASGNYVWAKKLGDANTDVGTALVIDASGNSYITGYFVGTVDFDPGAGTQNLTSAGNNDIFLAKYDASGNYVWAKGMGGTGSDQGLALSLDASGNSYITGNFTSTADFDPGVATQNLTSAGVVDFYLAKYDASGNYVWAKSMGGTGTDIGYALAVDASGNSYITGTFFSTADFDPGASTQNLTTTALNDMFLAKYDASGNYVWAKNVGGTNSDYGYALALDGSSNCYVTGYYTRTADFDPGASTAALTAGANVANGYMLQLNNTGDYGSAKLLGDLTGVALIDEGIKVKVDASGNSYITGHFSGTVDFDPGVGTQLLTSAGGGDIFLAKYDASGNFVWAKNIGGTGADIAYGLAVDASGNCYVAGSYTGTVDFDPGAGTQNLTAAGTFDIFLAKYDASGNYVWARSMGGTDNDQANALAIDASGNCYITGFYYLTADFDPGAGTQNLISSGNADMFLAKYDASGNHVWAKSIGGGTTETVAALAVDASGNSYITGYFNGTTDFDPGAGAQNLTASSDDVFLAKYDAAGNYVWAKSIGGTSVDQGFAVAVDASGNSYFSGYFLNTVDFDPGAGTQNLTSAGSADIFLAKYDASGNYVWANRMGGTGSDKGYGLVTDATGNSYLIGWFNSTVDFDPGAGTQTLASAGLADIFLAKYDASGTYVWAKNMGGFNEDNGFGVAIDGSGNSYTTGIFQNTADFDPDAGTLNLVSINSYDIFLAKYGPGSTLPVRLESFTGQLIDNGSSVLLQWTSAAEEDHAYFEVKRSNGDNNFTTVGRVTGCGTCNTRTPYRFTDHQPLTGKSYYRLSIVDKDGKAEYSKWISIHKNEDGGSLVLYPTITSGRAVAYYFCTGMARKIRISIFDVQGRVVQQNQQMLAKGGNQLNIDLTGQVSGVYYVQLAEQSGKILATGTAIRL